MLQRAEEIEHLMGLIKHEANQDRPALRGKISIGMPPAAALRIGPRLAQRMAQAHPHVTLHLRDGVSSLIHEWVIEKRIDLGLAYNATPIDGLENVPLLRERAVLVGPPDEAAVTAVNEPIRLRDIAGLPLIMPSLPHNNRRVLEEAAARHGVRLVIRTEVDSVALTKAMVREGQGYTILSHASVDDEVSQGELSRRVIDNPPVFADLFLIADRSAKSESLKQQVMQEIQALVFELCDNGAWPEAVGVPKR